MPSLFLCFNGFGSLPFNAASTAARAESPVIPSEDQGPRISSRADFTAVTRLSGGRTVWSVPANDVGAVPSNTVLHLQFLLARDPQVQAAFEQSCIRTNLRQEDPANPVMPRQED